MLRDTAKTASLSSEKGARFCLSHSQARSLSANALSPPCPLPFISTLRHSKKTGGSFFPCVNLSTNSQSGKGTFVGSHTHAASSEKGLPTRAFRSACLGRLPHPLDNSPVTLLAQYIAENFTCPLPHQCSIT